MVEASYLRHNYELTTLYLDLKAHYVTLAHRVVWHNLKTSMPCVSIVLVGKVK